MFFQFFTHVGGEFAITQTASAPSTTAAAVTSTATVPATTAVNPTTWAQTTTAAGIIAANPSTVKVPSQMPNSTIATTAPITTLATTVPFSTIAATESIPTTTDLSTTSNIEGTVAWIN